MNFASTVFIVFLLCVLVGAWQMRGTARKGFMVLASFIFYGYWFPPYILLLLTSGLIDYAIALRLPGAANPRRLVALSVVLNLGLLFFFKYYNFFLDNIQATMVLLGLPWSGLSHTDLILPIGISFYTFQSMSYTFDVARGRLPPCRNPLDFFLYLGFFPQLVAGPIVRAVDFIPQINRQLALTASDIQFALYRIIRGFFLKLVLADNLAPFVDQAFVSSPGGLTAFSAWLGVMMFAAQIFCDFSGYSDIAIGSARLLGFRLQENFNNPYAARSLMDFWRRWHISLSTWFRDYVYIPLGGNRLSPMRTEVNVITVFLLSGFWHGANWTFLLWGAIHGLGIQLEKLLARVFRQRLAISRPVVSVLLWLVTLVLVLLAWVPFRAADIGQAMYYWSVMFSPAVTDGTPVAIKQLALLLLFILVSLLGTLKERHNRLSASTQNVETAVYFLFILLLPGAGTDFIYFQF